MKASNTTVVVHSESVLKQLANLLIVPLIQNTIVKLIVLHTTELQTVVSTPDQRTVVETRFANAINLCVHPFQFAKVKLHLDHLLLVCSTNVAKLLNVEPLVLDPLPPPLQVPQDNPPLPSHQYISVRSTVSSKKPVQLGTKTQSLNATFANA
jgi:hypothetical protein